MDTLPDEICRAMRTSLFQFSGIPDSILERIDIWTRQRGLETVLTTMRSLVEPFRAKERSMRQTSGNSGMAGEQHMAAELHCKYLEDSIRLLEARARESSGK